jgi:hypothetical protein
MAKCMIHGGRGESGGNASCEVCARQKAWSRDDQIADLQSQLTKVAGERDRAESEAARWKSDRDMYEAENKSLQFVIDTTVKAMKGEELTRYEMGIALAQDAVEIVRERDRVLGRTCDRCKQAAPLSRMVTVYRTGQVPRVRCQACYQVATEAGDWFLEGGDL